MAARSFLAVALLSVAIPTSFAIPPPDFGFPEAPNDTALSVTYQSNGNSVLVAEANLFGVGSMGAPFKMV
jgi:hypothetical protein